MKRVTVRRCFQLTVLLAAAAVAGAAGWVHEQETVRHRPTLPTVSARLIVKLRPPADAGRRETRAGRDRMVDVAARRGLALSAVRPLTGLLHVVAVDGGAAPPDAAAVLEQLRGDPEVEYAVPDGHRFAHAVPDDPLYAGGQWYLQQSSVTLPAPAAVDAVTGWDVTTGSTGLVIADLDTGVRYEHPDLLWAGGPKGRLLPGHDFVSDAFIANKGGSTGGDPDDPGDWVTQSEITAHPTQCPKDTQPADSSWHGTRTAGILGALTNNGVGVAGLTWQGWILPVRVLGKCGGFDSDIVEGMLWAAGEHVDGVPDNPYPARIENLSLGGTGSCSQLYQDAINQLSARGVLVVVSAGNEGGPVDQPANCAGAVAVAGLRHAGTKVGYSNLGPEVTLAAPAGNCVNSPVTAQSPCLYPITSTTNTGTTVPAASSYTDQVANPNLGTSFSAPIVSGIAGLMLAVNANLTPSQMIVRLQESAQPFPQSSAGATQPVPMCHAPTSATDLQNNECICTNDRQTCGAGMANADAALNSALRPIAVVSVPTGYAAGAQITLGGTGSVAACGHTVAHYAWSSSDPTHPVGSASGSSTTVTAPASSSFDVVLTVIDDQGLHDQATIRVAPSSATTTAPQSLPAGHACLAPITVPDPVTVSIAPSFASLVPGSSSTQSFTATVSKTLDTTVSWQVNGVPGGNATVGTITSAGLYTPPAKAPPAGSVSVTAVAAADTSKSAVAYVTLSGPPRSGGGALGTELPVLLGLWALRRQRARRSARSSQLRCALR